MPVISHQKKGKREKREAHRYPLKPSLRHHHQFIKALTSSRRSEIDDNFASCSARVFLCLLTPSFLLLLVLLVLILSLYHTLVLISCEEGARACRKTKGRTIERVRPISGSWSAAGW